MIPCCILSGRRSRRRGQGVRPDSEGVTDQVAQVIDSGPGQVTKDVSALTDTLKTRGTSVLGRRAGLAGRQWVNFPQTPSGWKSGVEKSFAWTGLTRAHLWSVKLPSHLKNVMWRCSAFSALDDMEYPEAVPSPTVSQDQKVLSGEKRKKKKTAAA